MRRPLILACAGLVLVAVAYRLCVYVPPPRHHPIVTDLELLKGAQIAPPKGQFGTLLPKESVPDGALPAGHALTTVTEAGGYRAVQGEVSGATGWRDAARFFDAKWRPLGEVRELPSMLARNASLGDYRLGLFPNRSGTEWIVEAIQQGKHFVTDIGVVRPPDLTFHQLCRLEGCQGARVLWRDGELVVIPGEYGVRVLVLDAVSKRLRSIYDGEPRQAKVFRAALSPGGNYLAFSLREDSMFRKAGIWLLDLRNGECDEIIYGKGEEYSFSLVEWGGDGRLRFQQHAEDMESNVSYTYLATLAVKND
jgi:hypothetical protein